MRMRRLLLAMTMVAVLAAAALIPVAVFASPRGSDPATYTPGAGERIPWELSGAVWNECPMRFQGPEGLAFGVGTDEFGQWNVTLYDDQGGGTTEDELGAAFPELVEPVRMFRECLNKYPTTPYQPPRALGPAQREMYWAYVVTELAPCLREHGRAVQLPTRRVLAGSGYVDWYMTQTGIWNGSASLEEQLTIWNECPMLPSFLDPAPSDGVSPDPQQAD